MSNNSDRNAVPEPSIDELRVAAERLHWGHLSDSELETYRSLMDGLVDGYNVVDSMDAPKLPVKYPRDARFRPADEDNPLNAWYWKASIKGANSGKLSGKTVAVKDNICVGGIPMMNGSKVIEGFIPDEDATVVTRVLDAGGEILGKAVCENFCYSGGSHTSATGPVRNPHNPDYMSGGSSSGCAALIVTGECDMAIGGDQGGSIRMPSSFSGCYGIKPSYGLVPYTGACAIEHSIDHLGPMAGSAADCALLLEVLAGYDDGLDPRQHAVLEPKPYTDALEQGIGGLRLGILTEGFGRPESEADVDEMVKSAAQRLETAGAVVQEISVPMHLTAPSIMLASSLDGTLSTFTDLGTNGPNAKGHNLTDVIPFYQKARRERAADFPPTVKTILLFAQAMRNRYGNYYSAKALNQVRDVRKAYDEAFANVDLLVMPTTAMKALPLPPADAPPEVVWECALPMIGNTCPFDITGHPSMSVPAGMSNGLPVGMMLTGRYGEDDVVLRAGHAFEQL